MVAVGKARFDGRIMGVRAKVLAPMARPMARAQVMARKPALEAREANRLRDEQRMATALSAVMALHGVSNVTLGEWIGVSEGIVRDLKIRKRPLSAHHLMKLPTDFREALLQAWRLLFDVPASNDHS